jgi:molybdate transport system substrate-binding protein
MRNARALPPILPAIRRVLLALAALALMLPGSVARAEPVLVFAAASLKTALDEVVSAYGDQSGEAVVVSYGGSSALARQIEYGAPADLFISANTLWMDALQRDGLVDGDSRVALLGNRLALIAAPGVATDLRLAPGAGLAALLGDDWLAMAMVDSVPAGIYGRQALTSLGLWDALAGRIAQTDNVRAALALVATGETPLGIVYATDAEAEAKVRIVDIFPADSHPAIVYPAALTAVARRPAAQRLLDYLGGDTARAIFARHGFTRPAP